MKILRTLPDLRAQPTIQKTKELIGRLPEEMYDLLVRHVYDASLCDFVLKM
jgi:cell cycle arrest protein BUB2